MSIHIEAKSGEIAGSVLLPGDPLRAKFIAETYFENPVLVSRLRGMYCYTGTYQRNQVSVMGSGMGQASLSIYVNELFRDYGVQQVIRVGSCGAIQERIGIKDLILAQGACTNSSMNSLRFRGMDYAPLADFSLLAKAHGLATQRGDRIFVGGVLSTDSFYDADPEVWKLWASYGVLGIEMETAELYTLAAKYGRQALSILTVSDSLVDPSRDALQERETGFTSMAELALGVVTQG